jgi:lipopolysaccharide/colanic/teichoic acid biosynthesis glycosyltransferase
MEKNLGAAYQPDRATFVQVASPRKWQLLIKRTADFLVAILGLVFLTPVFLLIAILIKSTSKGPVIFRQKRVGLRGKTFVMCKFRTMHEDAERQLTEMPELVQWDGPIFRVKDDPRVTRIGKLLRALSIDELPQLFNVLVGEMSLVGPRPHLLEEAARYEPWHRKRLTCKPGMTCLWQLTRRHDLTFDEWIRLDLQYVDEWSLWLDFQVLVKTIPAVLSGS